MAFVKPETRFWNASGINVKLGADGLNVQTESLAAVIAGGLAFDDGPTEAVPVAAGTPRQFTLYKNETEAMAPPDGEPHYVRMRFAQALRGLEVGAPVEFIGVNIGAVVAVDLGYERQRKSFPVIVTAKLYPRRMGQAYEALAAQGKTESDGDACERSWEPWSAEACAHSRGSGSLLTGKLYISLDFLPASPRAAFDASIRPLELPTVNGTFQELEASVGRLVKKVNDLPLEQIVADLHTDLKDLHETLSELHAQVLPNAVGYVVGSASHARFCRSDFGRGIALATRSHGDLIGEPRAPCVPCGNWPTTLIVIPMRFCAGGERRRCRRDLRPLSSDAKP